VRFAAITLCIASQLVFIVVVVVVVVVVVYFVIDAVRKLLDTPSYCRENTVHQRNAVKYELLKEIRPFYEY
jgi:uncharacterized protein HemY